MTGNTNPERRDGARRLRASCLACRLLALSIGAAGIALAIAEARSGSPAPALTIAVLAAIVASLAGSQR